MEARRHSPARCRSLWPYLLTALLSLLAALAALAIGGITPLGEGSLAWQDNGQQVASDFGYVRGLWEGRHTLDWSYACGGSPRSAFHPTFNNLVSPLTWVVAAIPGLPALMGLSLLFLLQMALLPLGALFYLRRRFPRLHAPLGMALALAYAFGGFVLSMHTFLPFLNVALLFPWYVAALDALLRRGRWLPYTLLLSFMLAAGTYFAYMWLLFTAVYAAARTGWRWQSPVRQHTQLLIAASAGALLLSAFSWLPSLLVTAGSARAGEAYWWWNATRAELEGSALACIFCLPFVLAALLGFRCSRISRYDLSLLVVFVGLFCVSATCLWQLSRPWDFAGRFGYMADFLFICIAAEAAQRRYRQPGTLCRIALPLVCVGGTLMLAVVFMMDKFESRSYQASADRVQLPEWAAEQLPNAAGRATTRGHAAVENLAFFTPFESMSHFTACITAEQEATLARWGYQQRAAVISTEGGTLATDTLLGMRYILSQGGQGQAATLAASLVSPQAVSQAALPLLALHPTAQGAYRVQENPYYFGMGLMMPEGVFPLSARADDPIARQQELLGKLLGTEHAGMRSMWPVGVPPELPMGCLHYLWHEGQYCYAGSPYERWGGVEEAPALWELPAGAVVAAVEPVDGVEGVASYSLYHVPLAALEALRDYGRELPVTCNHEGRRMFITCRSTEARSLLFLPLLWQAGYEARVDGEPAEVQSLDGFVGISMPSAGKHCVELAYRTPGKLAGGLISLAALPLLLLLAWRKSRRLNPAPQGWLNTLCRRLLLAVSMLLLLWPLLVLPVGLWWR